METQKKNGWLKIGQVARKLEVSVETIRMYESAGLVLAAKSKSGQRLYNEQDFHWLSCIRKLIKEQGLNIEGIRRLLALMPCWYLKPCTEKDMEHCPIPRDASGPCWARKQELPNVCKTTNCRDCRVYQSAVECTNLKALLFRYRGAQDKRI